MSKGVISIGITCPIIREGDNLIDIVTKAVLDEMTFVTDKGDKIYQINNKDVIGITESVIARAAGLYVTVDEIAEDIKKKGNNADVIFAINPIYSRNRFSMILKGIARAAGKAVVITMPDYDEVGNPSEVNLFTGVNIKEYYKQIVENEGKTVIFAGEWGNGTTYNLLFDLAESATVCCIYCGLHGYNEWKLKNALLSINPSYYTLADVCSDKNPDFGLLGTNKATEERLKLFPTESEANRVCEGVKTKIKEITGKDVIVMGYGDGSYKDLDAGIWEMADPVSSPGYTDAELLNSTPNEIKVKAYADDKYKNLSGKELEDAIKEEIKLNKGKNLVGKMTSQGTTPRRYVNLLASLMDLTSGSGERCTPIILIKNYFKE